MSHFTCYAEKNPNIRKYKISRKVLTLKYFLMILLQYFYIQIDLRMGMQKI